MSISSPSWRAAPQPSRPQRPVDPSGDEAAEEPFHLALVRVAVAHQAEVAKLRSEVSALQQRDTGRQVMISPTMELRAPVVFPLLSESPPPPQVPPPLTPSLLAPQVMTSNGCHLDALSLALHDRGECCLNSIPDAYVDSEARPLDGPRCTSETFHKERVECIGDVSNSDSSCQHLGVPAEAQMFKVRDHWQGCKGLCRHSMVEGDGMPRRSSLVQRFGRLEVIGENEQRKWSCVWIPNSPTRLMWDVAGAILLLHDMIFFPIGALHRMDFLYFYVMDLIMLLFWTSDSMLSFVTAYYKNGGIILDNKRIALQYLKTWFLLDMMILVPDWLCTVMDASGGDSFRILRILRVARIARLARLMKMKRLLVTLEDLVNSEYMSVLFTIFKLFTFMLFMTHFIGCLWYAIGNSSVGNPNIASNWIEEHRFLNESLSYRYFTSLHWSITQFTPGSMHIQPQNLGERMFAVAVLLFGMIIFSSFVSSMTSAMTSLRQIHSGMSKQTWMLRRYLRENSVPYALSFRVLRFVEHLHSQQEDKIPEGRVSLLSILSDQLRVELRVATTMAPLTVHPIFAQVNDHAPFTMQQMVRQAVTVRNLALNDTMFHCGQQGLHMFVVSTGTLSYTLQGVNTRRPIYIEKGVWVSEAVLWTAWTHVGELQALTECRMLAVCHSEFGKVILNHAVSLELAKTHAKDFIQWLNRADDEELTDFPSGQTYSIMMGMLSNAPKRRNSLNEQVSKIQAAQLS